VARNPSIVPKQKRIESLPLGTPFVSCATIRKDIRHYWYVVIAFELIILQNRKTGLMIFKPHLRSGCISQCTWGVPENSRTSKLQVLREQAVGSRSAYGIRCHALLSNAEQYRELPILFGRRKTRQNTFRFAQARLKEGGAIFCQEPRDKWHRALGSWPGGPDPRRPRVPKGCSCNAGS